jgi:light-regulated signal transduction histidine kinase (bacteriophytochrome)
MKMHGIMSPQSKAAVPNAPLSNDRVAQLEALLLAEQKRHQEEFRQFAYAVSHDLREPIRMIVSYSQLLERRYQAQIEGDGAEFMRYILEATQRMDRLLGDLLTYSHQFRSSDQPLELVEPEGALHGALLMLDAAIRESGAKVTNDPMPAVFFDFAQLTQLFRQLIANSILFRAAEPPRIHVSALDAGGGAIQFSVRDNGIGIDAALSRADLRRLQTFARPRGSRHRHRPGSGQTHCGATRRAHLGGI